MVDDVDGLGPTFFVLRPFHGLNLPCQFFRSEFRLLQESLANGFRHGGGRNQRIAVSACTGQLQIEVADDGGGLTNREIGEQFHLSEKTIKHYITNILQKLHVRSRVEAAMLAVRGSRGDTMK